MRKDGVKSLENWRDSGQLERAVEGGGGRDAFGDSAERMLDEVRAWRAADVRRGKRSR